MRLAIYDLLDQESWMLVNDFKQVGSYSVCWDGKDEIGNDMPAGIYIYRIKASSFANMKKIISPRLEFFR